ncbi:hypothetical protein G7Z17_g7343 [Cylindrodendrum hubeiense]|uniref:Heterokaryon incompatibility domain-containing protein n=1 Tax=Cylindrodendrum hubeiense TaxID=595255 RepID=A0A9P5H8J1_9HYPO|nr:hypothetical protein G7Z17_g7343 [Cylindrodendrum hubeiense]
MRLLHIKTLQLHSFQNTNLPRYAILSHTWGDEEIIFDDVQNRPARSWRKKPSFSKLEGFCNKAHQNGYEYVWIDTCCINQSSSAELSEAINSMFQWYNEAEVCYVYLEDATANASIDGCRWFTLDFDIAEAQIQRITIVPQYDRRKDPIVQGTPLRIKPLFECDPGKYSVEDTFPERLSETMLASCRYTVRGIIMFYKPSSPRFCVVWESKKAKPPIRDGDEQIASMWCKVWPLADLKRGSATVRDDAAFAKNVVKNVRMRDRSFDSLYDFDGNDKPHIDSALLGGAEPRRITAKLNTAAFLGRTIIELEVHITKVDDIPAFATESSNLARNGFQGST